MMLRLLLLSLSICAPLAVWAGDGEGADEQDGKHLLFAMSQALHQVNYRGTFTYRRDDQMQGIEITHGVEGAREFERMVSLNGPAREIVRDDEQVRCEFQNDALTTEQSIYPRPFVLSDSEQLNNLDQFYQISSEKSGSIAGFGSHKLSLIPKDLYRYGYRFWVSSDKPHLLLRSEMVAGTGEILEQLLFTSLEILNETPKEFEAITARSETSKSVERGPSRSHRPMDEPEQLCAGCTVFRERMEAQERFQWQVTQLPPGYYQETKRFSNMVGNEKSAQRVEHHLFGDGFSSVSLFIELMRGDREQFQPIASQMGAVSLVSYLIDGHKIVVVGEVPLATAELIAHSVELVER
ncbi:MAG: hypothetical protein GQ470_05600 [Gammaproteobacteria bacterium]|nr:hypothetical protein [Gammaproteobacteria bacterium]